MFLLDTNHITFHQHGDPRILARTKSIPREQICVSVVSFEEQLRGWLELIRQSEGTNQLVIAYQSLREMQEYFCKLKLLDFDARTDRVYQNLRKAYRRHNKMDLRIAATALANQAILVTQNRRDFIAIEGLQLEDWTTEK